MLQQRTESIGMGRFQISASVAVAADDSIKHMVFLVDTLTGRTWRYGGSPNGWRSVEFVDDANPAPAGPELEHSLEADR